MIAFLWIVGMTLMVSASIGQFGWKALLFWIGFAMVDAATFFVKKTID